MAKAEKNAVTKVQLHKNICSEMNRIYKEKNERYQDSFSTTFTEYGPTALMLRLDDKLNRVKALLRDGNLPTGDESIQDTLQDLANYAIMGIIELGEEVKAPPKKKKKAASQKTDVPLTDLEAELMSHTKGNLLQIADSLEVIVARKASKTNMISKIISTVKDEEVIYSAIDSLFSDEEEVVSEKKTTPKKTSKA